jgi:hypothetical protein
MDRHFFLFNRVGQSDKGFYVRFPASHAVRRSPETDANSRILACRKVCSEQPFQFTIFPDENGYHLRVNCGAAEYFWPQTYPTLEKAGEQILKALKTASECRREIPKPPKPATGL